MTYFIYGVLGMLFTIALFAGGIWLGWSLRVRYEKKTKAAVQTELSEEEKRRVREEAQAFNMMTNYSTEMAYGLVKPDEIYDSDKG